MGAPAISPRSRTAPRPKPKPKPRSAPRRSTTAASRTARSAPAAPRRTNHRSRTRVAAGGNVVMFPVNAVSGIADSGFVVGMSRSRAWIVVLGILLGGIVALNVVGLSLSSSGGAVAAKIDELQQKNSVQRARIANRLSNERITKAATALGLAVPAPDAVHYLNARGSDAEKAARRLADGLIANEPPAVAPSEADLATTADAAPVDPATTTPVDPATTPVSPAATPVDPATAYADPAATATTVTPVTPTATPTP